MNSARNKSRLGVKFTLVSAIALIISFSVFFIMYDGVSSWFLNGTAFDSYWADKCKLAISSFQEYVSENEMTMDEAIRDIKWEKSYRTMYLYLGNNPDMDIPEENGAVQVGTPIKCSDGTVYAYAYPSLSHYDSLIMTISLALAAICFFLFLIPYVYRIIRRITHLSREMEILSGGRLDYHIDSPGTDELAELGRNIESMRLSVIEQMSRENEAVLANSRLITSLSHDLRTPLTKLTGYLEILHYKMYHDAADEERYLTAAIDKAKQMKVLSDEMFRHFQVNTAPKEEAKNESVSGALLLSQILSEMCFDLQSEGFEAKLPVIEGEYCLSISVFDLQRIFNNLFSNIKKYADSSMPVIIAVSKQESNVGISISNYIGKFSDADSNGIGLPTAKSLAEKNGGSIDVTKTDKEFCVKLVLPIGPINET